MTKPQPPRGTQDLIGEAAERHARVIAAFEEVARSFGHGPVVLPVFEATSVFQRSLGETSDVVAKEMYSFEDRSGHPLTLRPEFTAGIARAYASGGWQRLGTVRLFAHGPLFRYERPQKGRFRQFHQVDAEILGAAEPEADVELIAMAWLLLQRLGLETRVELRLATLGDRESRDGWREALVRHFGGHARALSADSRARLERNPLRILDSKAPEDRPAVEAAPGIEPFLTDAARAFRDAVEEGLAALSVPFRRDPRLVRGFDYYRHTAFEIVTDQLGAQGTVIGGGRYDGLVEALGGPSTPATGWAGGVERLAMLLADAKAVGPLVSVIADGEGAGPRAGRLAQALRRAGLATHTALRGNPRKRAEAAARAGAALLLYVPPQGAPRIVHRVPDGGEAGRERLVRQALDTMMAAARA